MRMDTHKVVKKFLALFALLLIGPSALAVRIHTTGSTADISTSTSPLICLAGGGSDNRWGQGWRAMLEASGGGDIVIIRSDGQRGGYESWIYNDEGENGFPRVNSVKTITVSRARDANRADVERMILNAELIFFAGGDQSRYINWFKNSRLIKAVNHVMLTKRVPVGGSSAGMALMAGIDYRADLPSPADKKAFVTAEDVLKDPTGKFIVLDRDVLIPPFMKTVITETHFSQRNRKGRLMGFMARAIYNNYDDIYYENIRGIGADEGTAICYDETGIAQVYGAGSAYFLQGVTPIERVRPGSSLDWFGGRQAILAYTIKGSNQPVARFNMSLWRGFGGLSQYWWVDGSSPFQPTLGESPAEEWPHR